MNPLTLLPRLGALSAAATLIWTALPSMGAPAQPGLTLQPAAPAVFLTQPGSGLVASSLSAGSNLLALPSSVMPFNVFGGVCSVETSDPGAPPRCSATVTSAGTVQRCSAHCDSQQRCSAFISAAGGTAAQCSTLGGTGPKCSVLQPPLSTGAIGPAQCSAFGGAPGTSIQCSVIGTGAKQICSAQNPSRIAQNMCSTFNITGATGGQLRCSVLFGGGGLANNNSCSVGSSVPPGMAPKFCSAHAVNSQCSVLVGSRGKCTTFAGAPAGTCSAFVAGSFCSVIGGAAGVNCKWP